MKLFAVTLLALCGCSARPLAWPNAYADFGITRDLQPNSIDDLSALDASPSPTSVDFALGRLGLSATWTPEWSHLVAYWPFENSWTDVISGNVGTPAGGATFVSNAQVGAHAAMFDGASGVVTVPLSSSLDRPFNNDQITIAAWMNITAEVDNAGVVSFGSTAFNFCFPAAISTIPTGVSVAAQEYNTANTSASAPLAIASWHHVVMTFGAAALELYIDGVLAHSQAAATSLDTRAELYNLVFGSTLHTSSVVPACGNSGEPVYYSGIIDEVAIWEVALSANEVAVIYAAQR